MPLCGTEPGGVYVFLIMAMAGRKEWVQADVRCLMCGRVLGRLVGRPPTFAAFRPAEGSSPAVRLAGGEQFRCSTCGGRAIMDEVETFSTYDEVDEELDKRPRRGRPPKPWRRGTDSPSWIEELGIAG